MKQVLTVLGERPQFIKASAVSAMMGATSELSEVVAHNGQHLGTNMSEVSFHDLDMTQLKNYTTLSINASDGVQHEAYSIASYAQRDETKWTELIQANRYNLASPTSDKMSIVASVRQTLTIQPREIMPYGGDGQATQRIVEAVGR